MTPLRVPAWPVAVLVALLAAGATTAAPARGQERCDGVRVVVDAVAVGGDVTTRCAAGDPGTGLEALRVAGHTYTFVPRQPGLVCTIDARPDPCNGAPQDAYWSYWHAEAGGSWTYSTRGAGNRDPAPGTVEGWAFGAGDPPRQPPPAAAAPAAEPEPAAEPQPEPASDPPADDPGTSSASAPRPGQEPADDVGDDTAADPSPDPTDDAATDGAVTDEATIVDVLPSPEPSASPSVLDEPPGPEGSLEASPSPEPLAGEVRGDAGGAPVGLIAGGLLVAGLAGATVVRSRRRPDA